MRGPKCSSVQAKILAMSRRDCGAMMTSMFLFAGFRGFFSDFSFDLCDKLTNCRPPLQHNSLTLIDFGESLLGCLAESLFLGVPFLVLFLQETQSFSDDFAGVAVPSGRDLALDKLVQMVGQIDIARRH